MQPSEFSATFAGKKPGSLGHGMCIALRGGAASSLNPQRVTSGGQRPWGHVSKTTRVPVPTAKPVASSSLCRPPRRHPALPIPGSKADSQPATAPSPRHSILRTQTLLPSPPQRPTVQRAADGLFLKIQIGVTPSPKPLQGFSSGLE